MLQPSSSDNSHDNSVLSVSSLNKLARSLLESNFPAVAVEGEISNLATPASGHWYLTLKDKNSQLRCAMFRNRNQLLRFRPRNGMQVVIRGRLSIYEGRGDYQLIADAMEEAGDGALRRAFEELKLKLQQEGLFDPAIKQDVSNDYQHIGIITSASGAAVRDIISVFRRRFPATRLTLLPTAVQGADAPAEIVRAISMANSTAAKLGLQALIVGRGGGSLEDLQAFNDETVARAIFASELPITSAVGHEIDFTIADFVADLRAPTPSAAAELMSPNQEDYLDQLAGYRQQLQHQQSSLQRGLQQALNHLGKRLHRPDRKLQEHAQTLDRLQAALQRTMANYTQQAKHELSRQRRALQISSPLSRLAQQQQQISHQARRYRQAMGNRLTADGNKLAALGRGLNAVNPLQVLARGYSITETSRGEILRATSGIKPGDNIVSRLADGNIVSRVEEVSAGAKDSE